MTPTVASLIATPMAFVFVAVFATWYAVPWMRQRPAAVATATAHDLTWVILNFYVPVLWGTLVLVIWQLMTRRNELLGAGACTHQDAAEQR
jgi:hypothetical protein